MVGLSIQSHNRMSREYILPGPPALRRQEHNWHLNSAIVDFLPFFRANDIHMPESIVYSFQAVLIGLKPWIKMDNGESGVLVFRGSIVKNMYQRSSVGQALHEQVQTLTRKVLETDEYGTLPPYIQKALQKLQDPQDIDIAFEIKKPSDFSQLKHVLGFEQRDGVYRKQTPFGTEMTWTERQLPSKKGETVYQTYLGITDGETGKTQVFDCMTLPVGKNFEEEDHRMGLCSSYWDMLATHDIRYVDALCYLNQPPRQKCMVKYQELSRVLNHPDRILHKPNFFIDIVRLFGRISLNNYLWTDGMQDGYSMHLFTELFHQKNNSTAESHYEVRKNFIKLALLRPDQFAYELYSTGLVHHLSGVWKGFTAEQIAEELKKLTLPDTSPQELVQIISALDIFHRRN